MVVDALFDSLCRCLGAPPVPSNTQSNNNNSSNRNNHNTNNTKNNRHNNNKYSRDHTKSQPMGLGTSHSDVKRRTERVQLQDKQFDALFTQPPSSPRRQAPSPTTTTTNHNNNNRASSNPNDGLEQARAVAKAKMVANHRRAKRKSPASQRDDIFRTKRPAGNSCLPRGPTHQNDTSSTSLSSFWSQPAVAHALCFATPIHDTCSSDDDDDMPPNALTDSRSLLTTEDDTVTSTLFFERKYAHVVEHRPPMPLFDQFKVQQDLRRIVATDSHNSLQMMSVFQDYDPATAPPLDLHDDDDEEEEEEEPSPQDDWVSSKPKRNYCPSDEYQEPPPAVKVLTDSSCSTSSHKSDLEHSNHTFRR